MRLSLGIATVVGSALFPLIIRLGWGKLVTDFGVIGGWMAAAFIVGTIWSLNHGLGTPMITQTGAWVDQGLAAGIGVWVASTLSGDKPKNSVRVIVAAVVGGILGGWLLSLFL